MKASLSMVSPMTSTQQPQELLKQGRVAEAERAYEAVLQRNPDDMEALNIVALAALGREEIDRAIALLEHATHVNSSDAMTRLNFGRALHTRGDYQGAIAQFDAAIRLRPNFRVARLHLAAVLDQIGEENRALINYTRALKDAQSQGVWTEPATTPPGLQPLVERAVNVVRTGRRKLFFDLLEPLAQKYGRAFLARVEQCVRVYLGEETPWYPDPRQRPTFLFFPGLPTAPYFDRALFPWLKGLEEQTAAIREELLQLLPSSSGRERVFHNDAIESQNLQSSVGAPSWNGYYFYRHGERRADNCDSCPITAQALAQLPLGHVPKHGPEILFSVFTAGTHLLPHRGVTNTRVVGHLPLIVPEQCALTVGGELHEWQEGRGVVFDDTYEHEAWNRSSSTRVVLIFDLWNPYLNECEREAVKDLVVAIGDYREAVDALET
jgi:aspartate beta-hydroxylase